MKKTFLLLGLLVPALLQGQEIGLLRVNPDSLVSRTSAAVWGGIEEGQFRPTYGASLQWSAGAEAKAVRHGEKSSWTGALSFEQTKGNYMSSSMLLEPDYYPLDILEVPEGTKSRQDVRLEGGFLTDLGYEWAAGLKASARGVHTGKNRNLAHQNLAVALQAEPALTYVMDDDMGLVSSYLVRFRMEDLKVKEDGDDSYAPFLDKGLRYGSSLPSNAFQIQELSHGFSELLYSPEFSAGLGIVWKRGKAGNGAFQFPGSTLSTFVEYTALADNADHVFRAGYKRMRDQLRETADAGLQTLSDRRDRNLELKYEVRFLRGFLKSTGIVLEGNQWHERAFVGGQNVIQRYDGTATLLLSFSHGVMDLDLRCLAGRGWWKERGRTAQDDGSPEPGRMTDDWLWKMDYQMVPRTGLGGTLTCRIPSAKGLFFQLYGCWYRAYNATYLPGKNREIGTLKIGYNF